MGMRWTPEDIKAFEERRKTWDATGTMRTHTVNGIEDAKPAPRKSGRGRVSKYGNIRTEAAGMKFDSRREAMRWMVLRLEERAGEIRDLKRQIVYPIVVNGLHICDYRADFVYVKRGELVVEDSKGFTTREYKLKAKLMLAVHGLTVLES